MHKHTPHKAFLIVMGLLLAAIIMQSDTLKGFISELGNFGLFGAFITGIFHAYSFTLAPSIASFIILAENYNPLLVSLFGAMGATIGSFFLFEMIRKEVPKKSILKKIAKKENAIFKRLKYHWIKPLMIAVIFASPIPDELGVSLLGTAKYSPYKFLILVFFLSFVGISIITILSSRV